MTPRLKLRDWVEQDRNAFAALNADPAVMRFFVAPFTRAESDSHLDRYQTQSARDGFTMYAVDDLSTGAFLGVLGIQVMHTIVPGLHQPAVEIGWRLVPSAHGRGLATEGAAAVLAHAFSFLGLPEVVAITTVSNVASRRVMEKLRMVHCPELDFDHPSIAADHPFRRHVLYRVTNPQPHKSPGPEGTCSDA